jgi:capsular polysaccharide biosynthesis protein
MASTGPPFKIVKDEESVDLRAHYGAVAQHALRILWQRKWLIAGTVVAALVIAVIAVTQMAPRHTSEALIQVDLSPDTGTKSQSTVSVDATEVAGSVARIIRSRTTADAVVTRLGLDRDPRFERQPRLSRWLSAARSALGLQQTALTPRDLAVDALMRQVRVTAEPRSYLISVAVTAGDPEIAAKLANAVAVEYLRRQTLKELTEARSAVEHDLTDASLVYGPRHSTYLRASTKLEQLDARVAALRDASSTEDLIKLATGHSLIAADKVMKPSGPNILVILTLATLAGLSLGICLARYTPIGFVSPALTAGMQILLFAAYALVDRIFAIVSAGRAVRRSALLVRLSHLMTEFAGSAGSKAGRRPVGGATKGPAPKSEIATATSHGIADPRAFGMAPSIMSAMGEFTARDAPPRDSVAERPAHWSRTGWRPLLGILLCLAIAGLATVAGGAVSSLVDRVVQHIAVFRMPDLGAWIGPAPDRAFAGMVGKLRSAADREPRAENGVPSAPPSAPESSAILSAAEPVAVPRPVQATVPAASAPATRVPEPEPIAPNSAVPLATERTAAVPWADHLRSAADSEPRAENGVPSAAPSAPESPAILSTAEPVAVPRPVQATAPAASAPATRVPEPEPIAPTSAAPPATGRTAAGPWADPRLSAADSAALVARGDALLGLRDVASARLFYERAAEMGDGRAALRMGETFDPAFLDRAGIRGTQGDHREALLWYRRAHDLGDAEADRLLKTLVLH